MIFFGFDRPPFFPCFSPRKRAPTRVDAASLPTPTHQPQVGALVFDGRLQAYVPYDKEWVKAQTLTRLQRAAGGR